MLDRVLSYASPGDGWIVVNTHSHREKIAEDHLRRQGFVTYCPRIGRQQRRCGKFLYVVRPLFPGYMFVKVSRDGNWRPILSTLGVRRVIRFGNATPFLDPGFVEELQAREVDGVIAAPSVQFAPGQHVKIAGGPFEGRIATILEVRENVRLDILMSLLGQSVRVRIDSGDVLPMGARA